MKALFPLLALLVLLPACEKLSPSAFEARQPLPEAPQAASVKSALLSETLVETLSDESVYLLGGAWTDQAGQQTQLHELQGRPVVMTFVYTHCGATCPMLVHNMKLIARALDPAVRAQTAFVLVSLDPERDTPEQLRKFAKAHGLEQPEWTLLRGSQEDVRALAASVSVGYRGQSDGQIAHANLLTILNAEGEVAGQVPGANHTAEAVEMLEALALPAAR